MTRLNKVLIGIFSFQILLTAGIYFGSRPSAADTAQVALLGTEQKQIDRITIDDGKGKQTVLSKVNGQWQLPGYHQLPANGSKVEKVLNTLATTKSGWPVATTSNSRERFEVSDDHYQRRVILAKGNNEVETLYLGTSPGFRQLHVRKDGQDEIYSVKLNSYDYPAHNKNWLDNTLLRPSGEVAGLEGPGFNLSKQGEQWQSVKPDGEVVKEEADKLLTALNKLTVQEAVDKAPDNVQYQLHVKAAGKEYNYRFYSQAKDYFVSRDDYAQAFKVNKADFEKITGLTATKLVKLDEQTKNHATAGHIQSSQKKEHS
jgi:hypothetical protein